MAAQLYWPSLDRLTDANGDPINGGTATFYVTGTTTPTNVYADDALSTSLGSVVTTNAGGYFEASGSPTSIYLDPAVTYKVVLKDGAGVVLRTVDPVNPIAVSSFVSTLLDDATAAAALNTLGVYVGSWGGTGVATVLPTGWTSSKGATGTYTLTHNLNATYTFLPACGDTQRIVTTISAGLNSVTVSTNDPVGMALADSIVSFVLVKW
jgi:hypothetical protein